MNPPSPNRTLSALVVALAATVSACHARPRSVGSFGSAAGTDSLSSALSGDRGRTQAAPVVELDLSRGIPETGGSSLIGERRQTYFQLVEAVSSLANDQESPPLFVRFGTSRLGWSRAQELGLLLAKLRESGRKVVCHGEEYTNSTAWLATRGCDSIWVSPAGGVETVGVAAQVLYAHRLLAENLGVDVDFLQVGKFKGAEEPFTRDGASPEARESIESTLQAIRDAWVSGMVAGRGELMAAVAEDGPFDAEQAKARGLVDAIGYLDEARDHARHLGQTDRIDVRFGGSTRDTAKPDWSELLRLLAGGSAPRGGPPHVAVLRAIGAIALDGGGGMLGERAGITERTLGRSIRLLAENKSTRAVVLRIDSPGGSALASDLLWHQLMRLREKKPIIVSIGDMAASGGYYLACTGTRILAEPTSIVGSIGVVGGKLAFGRTLERLGVHVETFAPPGGSPSRAAYESPLTPWDAPTRARMLSQMQSVYDLFLRRVAEGRGIPVDTVKQAAEGRIFAGNAAKDHKLVDAWGGLEDAIRLAKELAHLGEDAPVRIAGESPRLLELFDSTDDTESGEARAARWAPLLASVGYGTAGLGPSILGSSIATAGDSPLSGIGSLLASVVPLARGEQTLTALPFALVLY